jgi:hypothetical protein
MRKAVDELREATIESMIQKSGVSAHAIPSQCYDGTYLNKMYTRSF